MAKVMHSKSWSTSAFSVGCPQHREPKILCPFERQIKGSLQTSSENKDVYFEKDFKSL